MGKTFLSNADEIRYYIRDLLKDGEEHNRQEITDYIRERGQGRFTSGMVTGALKSLVDNDKRYEHPGRGLYRAAPAAGSSAPDNAGSEKGGSLPARVHDILETTKNRLNGACVFNPIGLTAEETKQNLERAKKVADLIQKLDRFEKDF